MKKIISAPSLGRVVIAGGGPAAYALILELFALQTKGYLTITEIIVLERLTEAAERQSNEDRPVRYAFSRCIPDLERLGILEDMKNSWVEWSSRVMHRDTEAEESVSRHKYDHPLKSLSRYELTQLLKDRCVNYKDKTGQPAPKVTIKHNQNVRSIDPETHTLTVKVDEQAVTEPYTTFFDCAGINSPIEAQLNPQRRHVDDPIRYKSVQFKPDPKNATLYPSDFHLVK